MLIPSLLLEHFIVFVWLSVFCRFFYRVLITVCIPSVPRRTPLLMNLLAPSLLLGYRPTPVVVLTLRNLTWIPRETDLMGEVSIEREFLITLVNEKNDNWWIPMEQCSERNATTTGGFQNLLDIFRLGVSGAGLLGNIYTLHRIINF